MNLWSYFRYPFPSTEGFSAYRMPGMVVHGPLLLAFAFVGFVLCWPHPALRLLLIIWIVAGLYLGRDIAIYAHYAPLLTLLVLGMCLLILTKAASIAKFGAAHAVASALISAAVAGLLFFVAWKRTRPE